MKILYIILVISILGWMGVTTLIDQLQIRIIKQLAKEIQTKQLYTRQEAEALNKEKGWTFETGWIRQH